MAIARWNSCWGPGAREVVRAVSGSPLGFVFEVACLCFWVATEGFWGGLALPRPRERLLSRPSLRHRAFAPFLGDGAGAVVCHGRTWERCHDGSRENYVRMLEYGL